jgi:putative N6-adenine-specific DNA methylase
MQAAARARAHAPAVPVFAGDVSFRMTDFAARNAERAGVARAIEFKTADALQRPAPAAAGTIVMNPPYGERIGAKGRGHGPESGPERGGDRGGDRTRAPPGFDGGGTPAEFFAALATHWKRHYGGWTAWVLSPEMKLPGLMRLKETRRVPLWNGPIECRMFRFDITALATREPAA